MLLRAVLLAIGAGHVQAGTDGAMPHYFEQQLVPGTAEELRQCGLPTAIDVAGKLFPAALKVFPLAHRGKSTGTGHFKEVHKWLIALLALGIPLMIVFDNPTARYPPKAVEHTKRAAAAKIARDKAVAYDADPALEEQAKADKEWSKVPHRETLTDLMQFTAQLCTALKIHWVVAPFEADQQCAYASHAGQAGAVWPPHGDSDLPLYGIDTVLFRMNQNNGNHSRLSVFNLLGRVVDAKPAPPDAPPKKVDLRAVNSIAALADIVILGGCDYFKQPGVAVPTAHKHMARHDFDFDTYVQVELGEDLSTPAGRKSESGVQLLAARATFAHPLAWSCEWGDDGMPSSATLTHGTARGAAAPDGGLAGLMKVLGITPAVAKRLRDPSNALALARGCACVC